MVVYRVPYIILAAKAGDLFAKGSGLEAHLLAVEFPHLIGNAHHGLHADPLRELEGLPGLILRVHVHRTEPVSRHAVIGALLLERGDLHVCRGERQMEVLDAQVVHVEALH